MLRSKPSLALVAAFAVANGCLLFAGLLAPYSPNEQHREFAYAPPTRLHFVDARGHVSVRPFVYPLVPSPGPGFDYREDRSTAYPIEFFKHHGHQWHGFTVASPGNLFLFGTDGYGRDIFSRILFGGRISVAAALLATLLSLAIGAALGAIAGHFGGAADALVMRGAELALSLPWIYLLLAIRAFLPLRIPPLQTFFLISTVIGLLGWARPARLVRGVVLSAKERPFVMAARGFGASEFYLLRRHVLPQAFGILITQAVILVPYFVTAEATLSFLGLGMSEPTSSWGTMLAAFQQVQAMSSYWWMAAPILALVTVSATYFALADALDKGRASA